VTTGHPGVPDGIEPVVGWRYWGCEASGTGEWWLSSINRFNTWAVRRATVARCTYAPFHGGEIPHESCTCGVYAVRDLEVLKQVADPFESAPESEKAPARTVVVGTVAVWGRIVPGEWGWRGRQAYPRELWVVAGTGPEDVSAEAVASRLAEAYRVPVDVCEAGWALPDDVRPPEGADTVAMGRAAWDLAHSLDRLASAANRSMTAYEQELRRFFSRAGLGGPGFGLAQAPGEPPPPAPPQRPA
jgi:hypothetical protein